MNQKDYMEVAKQMRFKSER